MAVTTCLLHLYYSFTIRNSLNDFDNNKISDIITLQKFEFNELLCEEICHDFTSLGDLYSNLNEYTIKKTYSGNASSLKVSSQ